MPPVLKVGMLATSPGTTALVTTVFSEAWLLASSVSPGTPAVLAVCD
jgi:hypothetical protein